MTCMNRSSMNRSSLKIAVVSFAMLLLLGTVGALAHQTKAVGDGKYLVIVGFAKEPAYTDERNGLDLTIRKADDRQPVENLEKTLFAEITSPDGKSKRTLPLRAQYGKPGSYTADIVLTQPGIYKLRIWGMIYDTEFEVVFDSHEVKPLSDLRFPD